MAQIHWLVAGVMLCSIPASSLRWNLSWIHSLENRNLHAVEIADKYPLSVMAECQNLLQIFLGKREYHSNREDASTCFHHVMLLQIFTLFNTEDSRAAWKDTLLDQLLSSRAQSLEQLEQMKEEDLACPYLGIVVWKHFQGINRYLKEKEFNPCAWVVRGQMEVCLSLM